MLRKIANHIRKALGRPEKPIVIPITNKNILIITAFLNKGVITASYKGTTKRGQFDDNTLRNMMKGIRFEKSTNSFLGATAQLIKQITEEK